MTSYVYCLTCKPINKRYIGSRKDKCFATDFWKTYYTSSKVVKELIEQYGVSDDVWEYEEVSKHDTYKQAVIHEDALLSSIVDRTEYININFSANGAVITNSSYRKICIDGNVLYWPRDVDIPDGSIDASTWNIPPSQMGKRNWVNPFTMDRKLTHNDLSSIGYVLLSEFTKEKHRRPRSGMIWCNDGNVNKKVYPNEVPEGWFLGRHKSTKIRKRRATGSTNNKRCYTNGVQNVFLGDFDDVPDGFYLGLTRDNNENRSRKNK